MEKSVRVPFAGKIKNLPFGKIVACVAITAFMVMMLIKPDYYLNSARRGLSLYATSVLPSLFPFYFFSLLLTYIGSAKVVSGVFQKPVKLLYNAPKESAYVLLLSMLSGYPVGASMTAELYKAGSISQKEAKSIAAFASTSGPIFMLGTVGSAVFNDLKIGVIILIAHYVSALLNGIIFRVRRTNTNNERYVGADVDSKKRRSPFAKSKRLSRVNDSSPTDDVRITSTEDHDSIMSRTIANSTLAMLYVGGYIVICGMLVDTLALFNVDTLILSALGERAGQPIVALLSGLIEMTRGSIACSQCSMKNLGVALCAGIISFGGLSVTLQNYTFLSKCNMKFGEIILRKLLQSLIAFAVAFGLSFMP